MGYSTTYKGILKVGDDISVKALKRLRAILGKDVRDIKELERHKGLYRDALGAKDDYWYHVDLKFDENEMGLVWDDTEKSYVCPDMIMAIVAYMREEFPTFTLNGVFDAFGEEAGDIWGLAVVNGVATRVEPLQEAKNVLKKLLSAAEAVVEADKHQALTTELVAALELAAANAKSL